MGLKRILLRSALAALGLSALAGIAVFLFGSFGETEFRLLMTTLAVAFFSLTGLSCAALDETGRLVRLARTGMVASLAAFAYALGLIWEAFEVSDWWETGVVLISLAVGGAHASALSLIRPEVPLVRRALMATLGCIAVVTAMLVAAALSRFDVGEFYFRLLGVFSILNVLGTVVTPILHKTLDPNPEPEQM